MKEVLDPIMVFVLSARQNDHPLDATSCPKVAPESPKPSFLIRLFVISDKVSESFWKPSHGAGHS